MEWKQVQPFSDGHEQKLLSQPFLDHMITRLLQKTVDFEIAKV